MEQLSDAQIPCGEMVGAELIGMLEDLARACERGRKGPIRGELHLEPQVLPDVDWAPVFRNFSEIIAISMQPRIFPAEDHDPAEARTLREVREREWEYDGEKEK